MAEQHIFAAGHGDVETMLPNLVGSSNSWVSVTPYLPVRHRKKRETVEDYLADNLRRETGSRHKPAPTTIRPVDSQQQRREIVQYRRRRISEDMSKTRPGVFLRLEFDEAVAGPLMLGQLSHFGYGIFTPA